MAIGVTFPENEDVVAFGRKNEMLVLLVSKHITKRIGQLCWILAEKSVLKGFTLRKEQYCSVLNSAMIHDCSHGDRYCI